MANKIYQLLFKRTSTYALSIAVGAFIFERTFDTTCEAFFDNVNKGVSSIFELCNKTNIICS